MSFSDPQQNIAQSHLIEGSIVVDLGAGSGAYSMAAAKNIGSSGKVYAVEVQKDFLSKIKNTAEAEGIRNIEVIWGDIENMGGTKLADSLADTVILSNVLFQVEDRQGTLQEAKRILKPGGKVLVVDWADSFGGLGPQPEQIISETQIQDLFEAEGFTYQENISTGEHHFGLIFRKPDQTKNKI